MAVLAHFFEIAPKPSHPPYYFSVEWFVEWSVEWSVDWCKAEQASEALLKPRCFTGLTFGSIKFGRLMENYMFFQLKVRLNLYINSSNGFHILRLHFKFTYSVAFSENHGSVTFSENRKSMMSYHRDFPVVNR